MLSAQPKVLSLAMLVGCGEYADFDGLALQLGASSFLVTALMSPEFEFKYMRSISELWVVYY